MPKETLVIELSKEALVQELLAQNEINLRRNGNLEDRIMKKKEVI